MDCVGGGGEGGGRFGDRFSGRCRGNDLRFRPRLKTNMLDAVNRKCNNLNREETKVKLPKVQRKWSN